MRVSALARLVWLSRPPRRPITRTKLLAGLLLSTAPVACFLGTEQQIDSFEIVFLDPSEVEAGSSGFPLTVRGVGNVPLNGTVEVVFDGVGRPGTVVGEGVVTAPIEAAEVAAPRTLDVRLRWDRSDDPTAPSTFMSGTREFTVIPPPESITIFPRDTTVEVGDTVVYRATATRSDGTEVDVTGQVVFGSTQTGVAVMDVDVARTVAPGTTVINGSHILGTTVISTTLNVVGGGGTGGVQIVSGPQGATFLDTACFDLDTRMFGSPSVIDVGASVVDATYLPAVDRFMVVTTAAVQVWRPTDGCSIELVTSTPYTGLNGLTNGVVTPSGDAAGFGNSLTGSEVRFFGVTPADEVTEHNSLLAGGGAIRGMGFSVDGDVLAVVTRSGTTTRVSTSPDMPPFTWTVGDPVAISPSVTNWASQGDHVNVVGGGFVAQAFAVDHATRDLVGIGSPLTTELIFGTTSFEPMLACVVGMPQSGNDLPTFTVGSDGSLGAAGPVEIAEALYIDDAVALPEEEILMVAFEEPDGTNGVKAVPMDGACVGDTSLPYLTTSGNGFIGNFAIKF